MNTFEQFIIFSISRLAANEENGRILRGFTNEKGKNGGKTIDLKTCVYRRDGK